MKGYRLVSPEAYTGNPFTVIGKEWLIVAAGTPQRHNGMTVAVKVDGGRSVRVRRLIGNVDLRIDGKRQDLIRRVGVVAIVMNVCIALGHVRVFLYLLGVQSLYRQRRRGLFR